MQLNLLDLQDLVAQIESMKLDLLEEQNTLTTLRGKLEDQENYVADLTNELKDLQEKFEEYVVDYLPDNEQRVVREPVKFGGNYYSG